MSAAKSPSPAAAIPPFSPVEEAIIKKIGQCPDIDLINLPQSDCGSFTTHGKKKFYRMFYNHNKAVKGIIFFFHGYSGNMNRPTYPYFAEQLIKMNFALVCLDFHGHGYSDGLKAYVERYEDLVDDAVSMVRHIYDGKMDLMHHDCNAHVTGHHKHHTYCKQKHPHADHWHPHHSHDPASVAPELRPTASEPAPASWIPIDQKVPFYLMGQSMGGAVCLKVAHYFDRLRATPCTVPTTGVDASSGIDCTHRAQDDAISRLFRTCILLAPAVVSTPIAPAVKFLLSNVLMPLFPTTPLPKALTSDLSNNANLWDAPELVEYFKVKDKHHPVKNPKALGYTDPIRFRTGSSLLALMESLQAEMPQLRFPFIVFHDPGDVIVKFAGTEQLMANTSTEATRKRLVTVENGHHDLMTNRVSFIVEKSIEWVVEMEKTLV